MSTTHLKEGDLAPEFALYDQHERLIRLSGLKGKKVVLFVYGLDGSPTCTNEVCNFRDNLSRLESMGFVVLGMSRDSIKTHQKFAEKQELTYSILSDADKKTQLEYGVFGEKKFMGKMVQGIYRTIFVIDQKGRIEHVIRKVQSRKAAQQVLDVLSD